MTHSSSAPASSLFVRPRRAARCLWPCVALLFAFGLAPRSAAAVTLREPRVDLSLSLDVPGARVCVVVPRAARNAADCEGIDVDGIERNLRALPEVPSGMAIVRFDDWSFIFSMTTQRGARPRTAEHIAQYIAGVAEGSGNHGSGARTLGSAPGSTHDVLKINGIDVIHTRAEFDVPPDSPKYIASRSLLYGFVAKDDLVASSFLTEPEHVEQVRPIAAAIVATASMPPTGIEDFGKSRHYLMGKLFGQLFFYLTGGVVLLVVLLVTSRKKKTPPPPAQ